MMINKQWLEQYLKENYIPKSKILKRIKILEDMTIHPNAEFALANRNRLIIKELRDLLK